MNYFVLQFSDILNIFTHIPTCSSSIWDGLKFIFMSLRNVTFYVNSLQKHNWTWFAWIFISAHISYITFLAEIALQPFLGGLKPSKKHLMYCKIHQNRGLNCIRMSQYELLIFSSKEWSFWQRLWILKICSNFEPRFQPKKSLFLKNSTMNFFVPRDHMNIFMSIPTCFSSIWDGLKSIFASLENATFCVNYLQKHHFTWFSGIFISAHISYITFWAEMTL